MMKRTMIAGAALLAAIAAPTAVANSSYTPNPTKPFSYIDNYFNGAYQQVGYFIQYCDGTTEAARKPGENYFYIEIDEGSCLGDLPFPGGGGGGGPGGS
ncbi:hypothetical protein [Aurantiacibacter sp. MUD61]|uniref:hypothetical protein n=1 Tax=Aurantiacibacter sp. MUD61 TaxID=3009083 RepID=UPI0022F0EDA9|nr:hypothetical protein [Aurantiacibacter sp. MUD61]